MATDCSAMSARCDDRRRDDRLERRLSPLDSDSELVRPRRTTTSSSSATATGSLSFLASGFLAARQSPVNGSTDRSRSPPEMSVAEVGRSKAKRGTDWLRYVPRVDDRFVAFDLKGIVIQSLSGDVALLYPCCHCKSILGVLLFSLSR